MPYRLNAHRTQDDYTDAGTLHCDLARRITLYVDWAPIYYQTAPDTEIRGETWEPEVLLPRGWFSLARNVSKVRIRSAIEGVPAIVTIEATKEYE